MTVFLMALLTLPAQEGETRVRFEVKAMPAPRPALKYQFLPTVEETETGSALQVYLKCFMEQSHFYGSKEANADRERWMTCPLKDLPLDKVRNYGGRSLRFADQAARMSHLDWQIVGDLRRDGIGTIVPEIQKLRQLAAALKVRLRGEIAEKKFLDAAGTIKTVFKLSNQLGDHPTYIGPLVGMALVGQLTPAIEEMIQEGGPNLYWALATLPTPLVSLRQGMQGDAAWVTTVWGHLPLNRRARDEETDKALTGIGGIDEGGVVAAIKKLAGKAGHVEAARKRLVEFGLEAEAVKAMTPVQVVLLDERRDYEERIDGLRRWTVLPYHIAATRYVRERAHKGGLLSVLLSAVEKVHLAQARVEQRLKLLQTLEAVRLHAAAHKGDLPKSLDDIDVPVPDDPITGKPFRYSVKDGVATLRTTPPKGMEKLKVYNVVYTLKLTR
jgi:hypothetical protein